MAGLRTTAEADLSFILEDGAMGFGWPITLKDPTGTTANFTGYSGDISAMFDPDTGVPVSGQLAHVALRLSSLNAVPFELPRGVADESSKPWVVTFDDIDGTARTFKIKNSDPDFTLGVVVCILEVYEDA